MRVRGKIKYSNGRLAAGVSVTIFERNFQSSRKLAETRTGGDGRYQVDLPAEAVGKERQAKPNIFIEVYGADSKSPVRSATAYEAGHDAVIDYALPREFAAVAEFDRLTSEISRLVGGHKQKIADLEDRDENEDARFIAASLREPETRIVYLILAHRVERKSNLPADITYALLRENVLAQGPLERLHAIRFVVDLSIDAGAIAREITLREEKTIRAAIDRAVRRRIVAKSVNERLDTFLARLAKERPTVEKADREKGNAELMDQLARHLDLNQLRELWKVLSVDHIGHIPLLLDRVSQVLARAPDKPAPAAVAALQMYGLFGTNEAHLNRIRSALKIDVSKEIVKLAAMDRNGWRSALREAGEPGAFGRRKLPDDVVAIESERLARHFERRYPTATFVLRLAKHPSTSTSDGALLTKVIETHAGLDLANINVARFMNESPVARGATPENRLRLRETLKGTQRLFRLTKSDSTAALLNEAGLTSSHSISELGPKRLRAVLGNRISQAEANRIERRARYMSTAAVLMAGDIRTTMGSPDPQVIKPHYETSSLEKWTGDFPNLKALFEDHDTCECLHCRSVIGPAAYLADVLRFLKNRDVKNKESGLTSSAKDILFQRRPDLGTIDLNCANALIELPHIDLVNELLEELVAPEPSFTASANDLGTLAAAVAAKKLPLGKNAMVTGPDSTGARILRGDDGVYSVASSGNAFTLTRLHQTHGTAAERAAEPEYVNDNAYDKLKDATIFYALPFDLAFEEISEVLERFKIDRGSLMRALAAGGVPDAFSIGAADLGLPARVANLIVTEKSGADIVTCWSMQPGATINDFRTVSHFLDRTGLSFSELETLIRLPFIVSSDTLAIESQDASCDLDKMTIVGGNDSTFDRIHRFLRLMKATGWPMDDLSRAIRHKSPGALDQECLTRLAQITRIARRTRLKPWDVATFYGPGMDGWSAARWASVFENPANKRKDESDDGLLHPGDLTGLISDRRPAIAMALGITVEQLTALEEIAPVTGNLTAEGLIRLYGLAMLNRAMKLSTDELVALIRFLNFGSTVTFDPLASPADTQTLLDVAGRLGAASLPPSKAIALLQFDPIVEGSTQSETAIKDLLSGLVTKLNAARKALEPDFDAKRDHAENRDGMAALVAKLPGITPDQLAKFDALALDQWPANQDAADFLMPTLSAYPPLKSADVINAWNAVTGAKNTPGRNQELNSFIDTLEQNVKAYLFGIERRSIAVDIVSSGFKIASEMATLLLSKAHLKAVPSEKDRTLAETIAGTNADGTSSPAAVQGMRLLVAIINAVATLHLGLPELDFLLGSASALNIIELDAAPYKTVDAPNERLMRWLSARQLFKGYPPIADPASTGNVLNALDVLAAAPSLDVATTNARLVALTEWDSTRLDELEARFAIATKEGLSDANNLVRLETAMSLLTTLDVSEADAARLAKPEPDFTDAAVAAAGLKARTQPEDWLGVQKTIQDRLRTKRRDALIAYLTTADSRFRSSQDLFDHLLVNVNMAPEETTSRIVLAHGTVQVFAQRCLMGIESDVVADTDGDLKWEEWTWRAYYRVWEAALKIYNNPEDYLDPDLRDDQTELFRQFRTDIAQKELTDRNAEEAMETYLAKLDDIAFLSPLACTYDPLRKTMHVFAATKGGDPTAYYYRRFVKERRWTPWQKIDLPDISGEHLVAFMRNRRLYLAWAVITQEEDKETQSTPMPDTNTPADGSVDTPPPPRRLKMQLAVSEYDGKTWRPKKLSKEALALGPFTREPLPDPQTFSLLFLHAGTAGTSIIVTKTQGVTPSGAVHYVGSFALTGCKGYPEPVRDLGVPLFLYYYPYFVDTLTAANRPTEQYQDDPNDFSYLAALPPGNSVSIFGNTPDGDAFSGGGQAPGGAFKVTYPYQLTLLDALIYWLANVAGKSYVAGHYVSLPLGTLLPFFFEDRNRCYVIVPALMGGVQSFTASQVVAPLEILITRFLALLEQELQQQQPNWADFSDKLLNDKEFAESWEALHLVPWSNGLFHFVQNFHHPLACKLRQEFYTGGIKQLMRRETQLFNTLFDFNARYMPSPAVRPPFPVEDVDFHSFADYTNIRSSPSYASYNWEVFFHIPYFISTKLALDQRFEEAFRWLHFIFDPTGSAGGDGRQKYWITKPFFQRLDEDYGIQSIEQILYQIAQDPVSTDPMGGKLGQIMNAIDDWREQPFFPFAVARNRDLAFQKAVVIQYIKTAVACCKNFFRQLTREALVQADQWCRVAEKLMGPKPRVVPPRTFTPPANFNELEPRLDQLSNALVELENLVPDPGTEAIDAGTPLPPVPTGVMGLYFCIPPNEEILELWDTIADVRFKIDNCLTLDGEKRMLALFAPPIPPGALARAALAGISPAALLASMGAPIGPYRFQVMAQKCSEFIQEVRTLGQQLLAALEKRDAEDLALLRSQLEMTLLDTITDQKLKAITEATEQKKAADLAIANASERQSYYLGRDKVNAGETAALVLQGAAGVLQIVSTLLHAASGAGKALPNPTIGMAGIGGSGLAVMTWGPNNVAGGLEAAATGTAMAATASSTAASIVATLASYDRRWDDWQHQARLAAKDIAQLKQLSVAANARIETAKADHATHLQQIANARAADAFMRSKFTNRDLHDRTAAQISAVYFKAYDLAFKTAKKAERALQYELGVDDSFIESGSWDSLRRGLGAADELMHQVKRMEAFYFDNNKRTLELTKHVSLLNLDPLALIRLRSEGKCTVDIPEVLFDLDYPGHFVRRLKGVSVTFPCVAGPHTTIACKLTLLSNRYRRVPTMDPGSGYEEDPGNDSRFVYNIGGIQSIATSQAQNDSGLFEFSFRDDRFLPFEGCGAVGTWSIELGSSQFRTYDPATIADVILHLKYTARDGGKTLRDEAEGKIVEQLMTIAQGTGVHLAFDVRTEFPDAWYAFKRDGHAELTITKDRLPFYMQNLSPSISQVTAIAMPEQQVTLLNFAITTEPETMEQDTLIQGGFSHTGSLISLGTKFEMKSSTKEGFASLILLCKIDLSAPP